MSRSANHQSGRGRCDVEPDDLVITSYSIHYTKLYDTLMDSRIVDGRHQAARQVLESLEHVERVITSYSIHYTKLYEVRLRISANARA